jgi:hypothetical protein
MHEDAGFFALLHFEHLAEYVPEAVEYLDLPPGHRFLVNHLNHEDIWFDGRLRGSAIQRWSLSDDCVRAGEE